MKEQFERRLLSGKLNIKCKNDDGSFIMWKTTKEQVVADITSHVNRYAEMGYRLTLRQLHYQLVGKNQIVNHQTAYKKLGVILDDCRYAGVVDWDMINDRGRVPKVPHYETSIKQALIDTANAYRLQRQRGQDNHVELWTEKDALSEILWRACAGYGVSLCVNKGYTSSSAIYEAYERFSAILNSGRSVTILYFGDHDPSGLDMVRDIDERLRFMMDEGEKCEDSDLFQVVPIGLNMQQIKQYKLPPNPAKLTDTRSPAYIKKFGQKSWEVDALDAPVLDKIVRTNIEAQIDMAEYAFVVAQEEIERTKAINIVKKIK